MPTQNPIPTPTPSRTLTPTQQTPPTPTPVISRFTVTEIIPSHRCEIEIDKGLFTAAWKNDSEFLYAYYPIRPIKPEVELTLMSGGTAPKVELQWVSHNVETGDEFPDKPFINFDSTFWERNQINSNAVNPELAGLFSPSGKYVIYDVFFGESFTPSARTEIWVSETNGSHRWKIYESSAPEDIYRAAWFENETKVIFNIAYEGPTSFYVSDFKTGKVKELSEISQFDGITEETWRLSPDGKTLAVVSYDRQLLLVSLETGQTQTIENYGGSFPHWSNDGKFLYYWWREDPDNWWDNIDELRVFDISSQKTSTLLDQADLVAGFSNYQGDDNCIARDYYLSGFQYAISPDQKSILLWENGLYVLVQK
jgi:WD40 repeat protein